MRNPGWLVVCFSAAMWAQQPCERLADLKLPHTSITSAASIPEGTISGGFTSSQPIRVAARCVVKAVARPTSDSEIQIEVWLPATGWNGKYQQVGNGGWAGTVPVQSLAGALSRGYATAGTDDGHKGGNDANWAIGHPEKVIDFGHRALRETTLTAKAVLSAFYGKDALRSYFVGCSDGGREALMEAQRYPDDFDGIVAGAPANAWSRLFAGFVWNSQALLQDPASAIPPAKLPAIQKAALAACDTLDGVKDGLVEDPRRCRFDPAVLTCKGADTADCLTPAQVHALGRIYAGPRNPRTGKQIFPGYPPSTEAVPNGWSGWIVAPSPAQSYQYGFGKSFYAGVVFEDPNWDIRQLNFDGDVAYGDEKGGLVLNSTNPDLRSFRAHGGRLLQYHGWGDAAIAAPSSIEYYESVRAFLAKHPDPRAPGARPLEDFYRLFLVPGMGHCGSGAGANTFGQFGGGTPGDAEHDIVTALDRWVEQGVAPDRLIGTGKVTGDPSKVLTRPLCPYPQTARYNGSGDPNVASSFTCAVAP